MSEADEWIPAAQAAALLGKTDRQVRRYKASGRVRSRVRSGRVEYHRGDLEQLRAELPSDDRPRAAAQELITPGQAFDLIREQQAQIAQLSAQLGYQRAQLDQRPALEDTQALQAELEAAKKRIAELEAQIARPRWRWPWSRSDT